MTLNGQLAHGIDLDIPVTGIAFTAVSGLHRQPAILLEGHVEWTGGVVHLPWRHVGARR
ncbi:hypothetical protein D3C75_1188330 [compost metagenome]